MYNTEKYIGACLESILNQTLQDFEVIVVDDCSTDNSFAVVENYIPKFGGRLKLYRMEKNSGAAVPSNRGMNLSRGQYIFVMDSDDLILETALEQLYGFAEEFGADVVAMDLAISFFSDTTKPFPAPENLEIIGNHSSPIVEKPTLESDDIGERAKKFFRNCVGYTAWQKFVKRDLLMENNITFPIMRVGQDVIWVIEIFCCAKKILTIPNPLYVWRQNPTSTTRTSRTPQQHLEFYMTAYVQGLVVLGKFLDAQKFFRENPRYKWMLFDFFDGVYFSATLEDIKNLQYEQYDILSAAFSAECGEYSSIIAYLCNAANISRLNMLALKQRILELENQLKQIQGG